VLPRFTPSRALAPGAKATREKNHEANQQQQAHTATANGGTAKVKTAAAKQEKQNQ
jgi:hypothetical protein